MLVLVASVPGVLHQSLPFALKPFILAILLLFFWRLYKFTILPAMKPDEPKPLPYWIPCHVKEFFQTSELTLTKARKYFGNTREPFAMTIAGQRIYVITSLKDMSAVYKYSTTLTVKGFALDLYTAIGMSKAGSEKAYMLRPGEYMGKFFEDISTAFEKAIEQRMAGTNTSSPMSSESSKLGQTVSVYEWCAENIGYAAIQALFGDTLLEIEPRLLELIGGISVNTNVFKVCFWLLSYILYDPDLLESIRTEIGPSISSSGTINVRHLLDHSPVLGAAFTETLRMASLSSSVRNVEAPVIIGNKILQPSSKILMPYRQLHFNEDVFGPEIRRFSADRFLLNKDLHRNPDFKPFGGGDTYCPGRFTARRVTMVFVALTLHRYDVILQDSKQPFPRFDETKPTLGIMYPV